MTQKTFRQFVWDAPTRVFHWGLVALIGFSWWSAETHRMDWHYKSGLAVCALILFRLLWGVFGTSTSRFAHFVRGPRRIVSYLRGEDVSHIGHNPLGGWSVVALLLTLVCQVGSGLFAVDIDGLESGPLSSLVDFELGRTAAAFHELSFNVLLGLIAVHLFAIAFYLVAKRNNLIGPMIVGYRKSDTVEPIVRGGWIRLTGVIIVAAGVTWWIANGAPLG